MATRAVKDVAAQINAESPTGRLRENGHLQQGKVATVQVEARHKHHYALRVAYSAEAPEVLPRELILKWYEGGYPYGVREGYF